MGVTFILRHLMGLAWMEGSWNPGRPESQSPVPAPVGSDSGCPPGFLIMRLLFRRQMKRGIYMYDLAYPCKSCMDLRGRGA